MTVCTMDYVFWRQNYMLKIKQYAWLATRFAIIGPLVVVIVLGEWAEEAAEYLDVHLRPSDSED